jgi:hypothetical protein
MIHNLGSKTYVGSLLGADSRTASANGTGFDLQGSNDAEGEAIVILDSEAGSGTSPTLDVKLQDSADNSSWSDISGKTFTQVTDGGAGFEKISINTNDVRRYVRAVATLGGTSPVFVCAVSLVYSKKYGN